MKAVILAGGSGTRLWPLSRDLKPKQFHAFVGDKTMLQQTYERLSFLSPKDIFVATSSAYGNLVKEQLPHLPANHLIIEPSLRDTAPCICFAAHQLAKLGYGEEVMAIIYADHLIQKPEALKQALQFAAHHIQKNDVLSVIAVRAKWANPSLGYIRIGKTVETSRKGLEIYELDRFTEKPNEAKARTFLASFKYLWNTGLYMWKVNTILRQFERFAPKILAACKKSETYIKAPKISIDYAIMEKINPKMVHVIPADLGWNDIGNWGALHEELVKSEHGNVSSGNHLAIQTQGSVVLGNQEKLIVTYGVKNMVIIDTDQALLVLPKEKARDVKKVVEEIRKKKRLKFL